MSSGNAVRSLPLTKAEPTGLAVMREPFKPHQIGKLPKPMAKRDVMDRLPKHHCELCGQYHATSKVMHLDYVGHAALTDRLLDADPNWTWEPVAFGPDGLPAMDAAGGMWIKLTVCGQVRLGYGHAAGKTGGDAVKEIIGDALRNAAIPLVTVTGLQFGALLGGAVVTETVFSWPGLGRLAVQSIQVGDFPVVQGVVLIFAAFTILANLAADIGSAWIDPRIRFD